jgi:glycine/sarcosine N-methyltransferase
MIDTHGEKMYDQLASDYDRFNNWEGRLAVELPFIQKTLKSVQPLGAQPLRVLDAACGTGMHTLALAKLGYTVSGVDLSAPMIEKARANAAAAGMDVRFEAVGFGGLSLALGEGSFDALLCLGNSLPHLLTPAALRSALLDFARCLRPGGTLLIQNRNFDAVMATRQRWMEPQTFRDNEHEWVFTRFYDFEPDGSIRFNMVTLKRPLGGDWYSATVSTHLAPQLLVDLNKVLLEVGFTNIWAYGSMTGEPFEPLSSSNLVLVASRK